MIFRFKILGVIFCILSLVACGGAKDNTEPPAELVEFQAEAEFEQLWKVNTGNGIGEYHFNLRPFVTREFIYVADYTGRLVAINKASGKKVWTIKTKLPISGGVGGNEEHLFVGTRDGRLLAFSQQNGNQLWQVDLPSEVLAPPVVSLGVVLVRTVDGNLIGLSVSTGEEIWAYKHSVPVLSLRGTSMPVAFGGYVLSGADNGRITFLSLMEGVALWEAAVAAPAGRNEIARMVDIDAVPKVDEGVIYVAAYQGRVAAVDIRSAQVIWARDKSIYHSLSVDEENLYAADELSHIWAFDRDTGATVWFQDKLHARPLTAPAYYRDYVLVGDFDGYLHLLSNADGRFVARTRLDGSGIVTAPIVENDVFYVLSRKGVLTAMRVVSSKAKN